jgi:6-phosphogluconolactonase
MTTTVPAVYAFPEFSGVAAAVADHVVAAQNAALATSKVTSNSAEKRFKIALSGGSLIPVLNEGLLARNDVLWDKWYVFI